MHHAATAMARSRSHTRSDPSFRVALPDSQPVCLRSGHRRFCRLPQGFSRAGGHNPPALAAGSQETASSLRAIAQIVRSCAGVMIEPRCPLRLLLRLPLVPGNSSGGEPLVQVPHREKPAVGCSASAAVDDTLARSCIRWIV